MVHFVLELRFFEEWLRNLGKNFHRILLERGVKMGKRTIT
jgi:hypothetical protein